VSDRIEHARRAKRPAAPEERAVERADGGGHGTVEAADAGYRIKHYLTLVRYTFAVNRLGLLSIWP
jgi:hypothetical protein